MIRRHRVPRLVPELAVLPLAALLALVVGEAIADRDWDVALIGAVALPLAALIIRSPFSGVLIWLAVMPLFFIDSEAGASLQVWVLHRLMVPGLVVLGLLYANLGLTRSRARLTGVDLLLALFLVVAGFNILFLSPDPMRATVAFYDAAFVPIALYWAVRVIHPGEQEIRALIPLALVLIVFEVAVSALSWYAPEVLPSQWLTRAGERGTGTLGGPGPYSVTLILLGMLVLHRGGLIADRWRPWLLAAAGLAVLGVFLSFSRGSWLGALVVIAGIFFVYPRTALRFLAVGLLLGGLLSLGPLEEELRFAQERIGVEDTAASRLVTNYAAVRMVADRPLTGFGYGNFEAFDEDYKRRIAGYPVSPGSAHNTYLAMTAELGLPAALLYLAPAGWLLWRTIRRWRLLPRGVLRGRELVALLWLALADQFIVSNFMDMFHSSSPWGTGLWWLTLALIHLIVAAPPRAPERLTPQLLGTARAYPAPERPGGHEPPRYDP